MKTPSEYEDLIDRLAKASLELKATIRGAHQASRDLNAQIKEAKALLDRGPVEELIGIKVKEGLNEMGDSIQRHTHRAYDKVTRQFDILTEPLLAAIGDISEHLKLMDIEIAQRQRIVRDLP